MSVEDAKQHPGSLVPNWGAAFSALDRLSLDRITREKKIRPLLSHNYSDFCYSSQAWFPANTGIHFYTFCANEHLDLQRDK